MEKIRIFKETPGIFPEFGPPKWVVQRPRFFERTFNTGDEAIRFVRDFLNHMSVIKP